MDLRCIIAREVRAAQDLQKRMTTDRIRRMWVLLMSRRVNSGRLSAHHFMFHGNVQKPVVICVNDRLNELRKEVTSFMRNKVHQWATDKDSRAPAGICWLGTCPATLPRGHPAA